MPMRPIIAAAALVLPITLAACGQRTVEATNEKPSVVASKVAAAGEAGAVRFSPGRWETTMQFIKMDVPGMPPEAKTMMEKMVGKGRTFSSCLTKEEAEKPGGKFFGQTDKNCTYDHFSMGGGKMGGQMPGGQMPQHGQQSTTNSGTTQQSGSAAVQGANTQSSAAAAA